MTLVVENIGRADEPADSAADIALPLTIKRVQFLSESMLVQERWTNSRILVYDFRFAV